VDVLVSAAKGSGIARRDEEVQIFGRCRREIDESTKLMLLTEADAYDRKAQTSNSSCHGKDRVPPGMVI